MARRPPSRRQWRRRPPTWPPSSSATRPSSCWAATATAASTPSSAPTATFAVCASAPAPSRCSATTSVPISCAAAPRRAAPGATHCSKDEKGLGPHLALKATLRPTRAAHYLRPGGPWDVPSLDAVLAERTPGAVAERVASVAGGLRARGVRRGDAVAWQLRNVDQAVLLYRACWRLGAVAVPVHHGMGTAEAAVALAQVEPRVTLTEPGDVDGLVGLAPPVAAARSAGRPADLAVALFTSGSTGIPKAVLHTQRGLAYKAQLMRDVHGLTDDDAVLMPAPLAHISGLLNGVLLPAVAGMRTVLMEKWDPDEAIATIADDRITFMIGPPTFFVTLMAASGFSAERVQSLRLISSGGAGVTAAFVEQATEAFGAVVKRTYGSTEAPTVTTSHAGDPLDKARRTDGRPTGEVELRISSRDAKSEAGQLWLGGPRPIRGLPVPPADRTLDLEATRSWFAQRGVTRFKTPERVVQVAALPTLAAGKPDRVALRELARRG